MSRNPLYDLVHQGESAKDGYDSWNRGTWKDDSGHAHMNAQGNDPGISSLTVGEIQALQSLKADDPKRLFAVGYYQATPDVVNEAVNNLGIDPNEKFSQAVQDKIFSEYLITGKRPQIKGYITGAQGSTLEKAQTALAKEWASFGDPGNVGQSHYPPPNHSSITLAQQEEALNQMRASYQANIKSGLAPEDAWKAVAAVDPNAIEQSVAHHERRTRRVGDAYAEGVLQHDNRAEVVGELRPLTKSDRLLREGQHGDTVSVVQQELHDLGYKDTEGNPLAVDRDFGPSTTAAIKSFQHDHGLRVDGVVGKETASALSSETSLLEKSQVPNAVNAPDAWSITKESSLHDMFEAICSAAGKGDIAGMNAVGQAYAQSPEGQASLLMGAQANQMQTQMEAFAQMQMQMQMQAQPQVQHGPVR
ncbi:peptidoglycan-binding protein [Dyella dinghuensis]|uniref:Peptidoglycan-binding protein n=1 Tax=Dyella dinghuensis TaxID=1920169 RepID=A0A432LSM0_9GAMM|nr:peptidoglycan-binding domain-containing protein [Dyella dinghuensis]RUL63147.1 peptidoglycan-binding protein [Dyella dinghuensis]